MPDCCQTRSSHESTSFNVGDETLHDRTVQPVVDRDASHEPGNEQSMLNEVNIDFRIPGLPRSVVKQAQNSRVRELVKRIENHPHRPSLQRDVHQNHAYNKFSTTTKEMIQDVGNAELFELFETDPKTQCKEYLSYWSEGIVYCTCFENNRDEELCRKWDALADEDHTHHLTTQEYSLYKSNLWLHSNKQGSNTVRTTHRSDFKKALSTLQQLKQKEEGALQTPTNYDRNQQWAQSSSSWWNWQGSWWTPYSYESHDGDETKY